jgi:DNA polymerase-3 subunit gamma/tau
VHADPRVQAVFAKFPGAQVMDVRRLAPEPASEATGEDPVETDDDDEL